ncbi:hypothetical protein WISP_47846 [Willisornis vidua]|uniref:NADH dehydrogenase [ubiquinone] 1 beta subcomplex subunit 4 n=1 Tax=Willisornis vidua TaxID=1566151 RepID=A0ABQ9DJ62_9PASS|nr:hypothetical protein WISP_47846 [Willisornis vidua]
MIGKSEELVLNLVKNLDVATGQVHPMFDKAVAKCNVNTSSEEQGQTGFMIRLTKTGTTRVLFLLGKSFVSKAVCSSSQAVFRVCGGVAQKEQMLQKENPALLRWVYARTQNVYPNFRPTPKTSFLGAVWAIGPILFWMAVFKADRDRKEKLIKEGQLSRWDVDEHSASGPSGLPRIDACGTCRSPFLHSQQSLMLLSLWIWV